MVEKIKGFFLKHDKAVAGTVVASSVLPSVGFMASGDIPDLTPIMSALTSALTVDSLISMIASVIGYAMPFVLMWFGYRFLKRAFTKAVMAGRL